MLPNIIFKHLSFYFGIDNQPPHNLPSLAYIMRRGILAAAAKG